MGVNESIYLASDSAEESFGGSSEPLLFQLPVPPAQTLQIKLLLSVSSLGYSAQFDVLSAIACPKLAFFWSFLLFTCFSSPLCGCFLLSFMYSVWKAMCTFAYFA